MMEMEEKWRDVEVLDHEVKKEIKRLDRLACGMKNTRIELLEAEGFIWDSLKVQWLENINSTNYR
jgi:23S rRNA maturation-related 3'-5' exoribonuclease YhaM